MHKIQYMASTAFSNIFYSSKKKKKRKKREFHERGCWAIHGHGAWYKENRALHMKSSTNNRYTKLHT